MYKHIIPPLALPRSDNWSIATIATLSARFHKLPLKIFDNNIPFPSPHKKSQVLIKGPDGKSKRKNKFPLLSYAGIIQIRSKGQKRNCFSLSPSYGHP